MKRYGLILSVLMAVSVLAACGTQESSQLPGNSIEAERSIEITAGGRTFHAVLYGNDASDAIAELLPFTIDMREMNGNEKYYYFDESFPSSPSRPSDGIHKGDLMLYGSSCLVVFYESFQTSYSYTPIGYIENPEGLEEALGNGSITVSFTD